MSLRQWDDAAERKEARMVLEGLRLRAEKVEAERDAYRDVLRKIANEDFRGNRPSSAVDAYRVLERFSGADRAQPE